MYKDKTQINMPTFLAEENCTFSSASCQTIEQTKNLRLCESKNNCVGRSNDGITLTKKKGS